MNEYFQIERLQRVKAIPENKAIGIEAFQRVRFTFNYFGTVQSFILDTKIMNNGDQIVIDGNGWVKGGTKI